MNRKILTLAAAIALVAPAMLTVPAYAQNAKAQPVQAQAAQAPSLVTITRDNMQDELKSDKPVVVLVTSPNCATCADLVTAFTAQAAKRTDWKFIQGSAADVDVPANLAPLVVVMQPDIGQVYSKSNFAAPADMDAFMTQRAEHVAKITAEQAKLEAIQKQIADKSKPFEDEMALLQEEFQKVDQPFKARLAAVDADEAKALEPLNKQYEDVGIRMEAAAKPFTQQVEAIAAKRDAATADLSKEWQELRKQVSEARDKGVSEDDATLKANLERMAALKAEYQEKAKPFNEEARAATAKRSEARKPFREEQRAIDAQMEAVSAPFQTQRKQIRTEANEAAKDIRAKAADVRMRNRDALGTLPSDSEKLQDALYELIYSGDQQ